MSEHEQVAAAMDAATRMIEKIRSIYRTFGGAFSLDDEPLIRLRDEFATAITAALAAERARWAAFADEKGEPRKVLGTLPVTADGAIVGHGDYDIYAYSRKQQRIVVVDGLPWWGSPRIDYIGEGEYENSVELAKCYSTAEAAIAARERKQP